MEDLTVTLSWKNISLTVEEKIKWNKKQSKTILRDISGVVKPGEVLAIMGPSGAGKSSLLSVLSGQTVDGVEGSVLINGQPCSRTAFNRISSFVHQEGQFFSHLTVREVLQYTADLRLPSSTPKAEKEVLIQQIIDDLDLNKCASTIVGNTQIRGISGGELKRLSIAAEVIHGPKLVFLDEPTTGLDSASALNVAQIIKKIALRGCTVICTIHQPRPSILEMFDQIMLLADGQTVFWGRFSQAISFFQKSGYPCPKFENPADYFLDLINTRDEFRTLDLKEKSKEPEPEPEPEPEADPEAEPEQPTTRQRSYTVAISKELEKNARAVVGERKEIVAQLSSAYFKSALFSRQKEKQKKLEASFENSENIQESLKKWKKNNDFYQFSVLLRRSFWYKLREPNVVMSQITTAIFVGLLVGSIYFKVGLGQAAIRDRFAALAFVTTILAFLCYDIVLLFPSERAIYLREHNLGLYSTLAFFCGRTIAEMPVHVLDGTLVSVLSYFMCGFQLDVGKFFIWYAAVQATIFTGVSLLLVLSALSKDATTANIFSTVLLLLFMLFNGFNLNLQNVIVIYRWIPYINFISYSTLAIVANEFDGLVFTCTAAEMDSTGKCLIANGEEALQSFGIGTPNVGINILITVALGIGMRLIALIALKFLHNNKPFFRKKQTKYVFLEDSPSSV